MPKTKEQLEIDIANENSSLRYHQKYTGEHQANIDKYTKQLEAVEVTYSRGDRFLLGETQQEYLLSYQGKKGTDVTASLVCLEDGTRWHHRICVIDTCSITSAEFKQICDGQAFTRTYDYQNKRCFGEVVTEFEVANYDNDRAIRVTKQNNEYVHFDIVFHGGRGAKLTKKATIELNQNLTKLIAGMETE